MRKCLLFLSFLLASFTGWGFEVNGNNGKLFRISADDMKKIENCPDKWNCEKMLLFGIGLFFNKLPEDLESKGE